MKQLLMEIIGIVIFIFGIYLSFKTFFFKEGYRSANRFLAVFLFLCSLLFFVSFGYFIQNSRIILLIQTYGIYHIYFLIGPLAFFYIRSILRDNAVLDSRDFLHFAPFVLFMLGNIPYLLSPAEEKQALVEVLHAFDWDTLARMKINLFLPFFYIESLRIMSLLGYGITLWALILKPPLPSGLNDRRPGHHSFVRRWLVTFSAVYSAMAVQRFLIWGVLVTASDLGTTVWISVFAFLSIALVFLFLNLIVFIFPKLSYGLLTTPSDFLITEESYHIAFDAGRATLGVQGQAGRSWYKSYFQDEYLSHIEDRLAQWIGERKYLFNASITSLSGETGIPAHHLSYYFNHVLGVKYTDWRNSLRVNYAKMLLDEGITRRYTMDSLAEKCGFTSRATFFRVFKEVVGVTPMEYIKGSQDTGPITDSPG